MDLVVDFGSSSVKAGFSGDDSPSCVIPSAVSVKGMPDPSLVGSRKDGFEINPREGSSPYQHPIQRGRVVDWDGIQSLWGTLESNLGITSADIKSVMVAESPAAKASERSEWAKLLFDTFQISSFSVVSSAPLILFAAGRTTGIAIDLGASLTSVIPVFGTVT